LAVCVFDLASPADRSTFTPIYGIFGCITLNAGEFIILITGRQRVARIVDHEIFKVTGYKIVPIHNGRAFITENAVFEFLSEEKR
jgi:hypothetical protein